MAGTGAEEYRARIEAACRKGGVRYEFLGSVSDERLGPIYAGCTLYAQASRTLAKSVEGFGISFLEASLYGKPVAAYVVRRDRRGGDWTGKPALLIPEGDSAALAGAIRKLLEDAALRDRLGEAGRRYAASFDWARSARVLCDFARRKLSAE